jgi:RNA polymerase sigma-B factor
LSAPKEVDQMPVTESSAGACRNGPSHQARKRRAVAEHRLLVRYRETRDQAARKELIECLLPLARHLAARYRHTTMSQDDLEQVAYAGLIKAIDRYDPTRGQRLVSYPAPTIPQ